MRALYCPCGFDSTTLVRFSAAWYRLHRAHHLAAFPDVDDRTIEVLDELIERAADYEPRVAPGGFEHRVWCDQDHAGWSCEAWRDRQACAAGHCNGVACERSCGGDGIHYVPNNWARLT